MLTKRPNQATFIQQRRRVNYWLAAAVMLLLLWVGKLLYEDHQKRHHRIHAVEKISTIHIQRNNQETDIKIKKIDNAQWHIEFPFQAKASTVVIQAFLQRLINRCESVPTQELSRQPQSIATVLVNNETYIIGELNTASDRVYVSHQEDLTLCDKLVASIALAPAIHFIDKNLYSGELISLSGAYGTIKSLNSLDLSVLDINHANDLPNAANHWKELTLAATEGQESYAISKSQDGKYFLLFSVKKQLLYVISYQEKIATIVGL